METAFEDTRSDYFKARHNERIRKEKEINLKLLNNSVFISLLRVYS